MSLLIVTMFAHKLSYCLQMMPVGRAQQVLVECSLLDLLPECCLLQLPAETLALPHRPSTAREHSSSQGTGPTARLPRPRTTLCRSSSASGAMPAAKGSSTAGRGPRASLSSSDLGRGGFTSAAPSPVPIQDGESDSSAAAPMAAAKQRPDSRNSLGRKASAKAAAGAEGSATEGNAPLPSARRASALPKSKATVAAVRRSGQGASSAPLPSARRGTKDAGNIADTGAAFPTARRGTKDATSSIPLPSARRSTRDGASQPSYTPRQSVDLSSKSGGRWM